MQQSTGARADAAAQPCVCGSGKTYTACCLAAWSQTYMTEILREGNFDGPQGLLESVEVETPDGWRPLSQLGSPPPDLDPSTQIRVQLSEFSVELTHRLDAHGLYDAPRVHPSRRKPPPPPPRKQRRKRK